MNDTPAEGKASGPPQQESAPITAGQVLRQVAVIVVAVVIWSAILVGYLALTDTNKEPPAATPQPTEVGAAPTDAPAATTPEVAEVSFSKNVLPIFEVRCQRCHGTGQTLAGLSLASHADVLTGSGRGPVVIPGSAETSRLVEVVVSGEMPRGGAKLPESEIQTISDWVDAGAPDN
jgi:mono/diheme cytochrome c family protein